MVRNGALCAALILAVCVGVSAEAEPVPEDLVYDLSLPAGRPVAFTIDFEVAHPGPLELIGEWSGNRVLSLRLEELGSTVQPLRRSGPSPQRLAVHVPNPGDIPRYYRLHVRGLANRGGAVGTLLVRRPAPPPPPPPRLETLPPVRPPQVQEIAWPADAPEAWRRFSAATDRFGDAVERDPRGDSCRWQNGLAAYLASRRDGLLAGDVPAPETVETLTDIVGMVRRVEALRTSTDPLVVGPPPDGTLQRERWLRIRDSRIRPVETDLDSLLDTIERGHAPELEDHPWAYRLVSCVIGCERHFEERVRTGEGRAVNLDLARAQWARLLEAADLLQRLTRLPAKPGGPDEKGEPGSAKIEPRPDETR